MATRKHRRDRITRRVGCSIRPSKDRTFSAERLQIWRRFPFISVQLEMVRPQRVDGDDQDVPTLL